MPGTRAWLFRFAISRPVALVRHLFLPFCRPCTYVGGQTVAVQTVLGDLIYLDALDTSLFPSLLKRGYWEPAVTSALLRLVRPGDHIVEVGAHVGYYTTLFASRVGATGSVTAFEADPRTTALLRQTLAANERSGIVQVVPLAVSDRPGPVTFHRLTRHQGSSSLYGFSAATLAEWDDEATAVRVDATSLDAFLGEQGRVPDLIKIDAEGAEPAIVAGMSQLLARAPHLQLLLEFLPRALERGGHDPRQFLASLIERRFRLHTIEPGGRVVGASVDRVMSAGQAELYLVR